MKRRKEERKGGKKKKGHEPFLFEFDLDFEDLDIFDGGREAKGVRVGRDEVGGVRQKVIKRRGKRASRRIRDINVLSLGRSQPTQRHSTWLLRDWPWRVCLGV